MSGRNLRRDALQVLALAIDGDVSDAAHALTAALKVHSLDLGSPGDSDLAYVRWVASHNAGSVWLTAYQVEHGRVTDCEDGDAHDLYPAESLAVAWRLCNEETCASHDEIVEAVDWAEAGNRVTQEMIATAGTRP